MRTHHHDACALKCSARFQVCKGDIFFCYQWVAVGSITRAIDVRAVQSYDSLKSEILHRKRRRSDVGLNLAVHYTKCDNSFSVSQPRVV